MAESAPARPPARGQFLQLLSYGFMFLILFNPGLRQLTGQYAGYVVDPVLGFGDRYPVLTILLVGAISVILTTIIRHFTTDWLEMAKFQAYQRAFSAELRKAQKDNNTYKIKKLQEKQPEVMQRMQEVQRKQMAAMPLTMLVSTPLYTWLWAIYLPRLGYWHFAAPWNTHVDLLTRNGILAGSSVLPHWTLLLSALTVPLGMVIQRTMKFLSWKERWHGKHPEVHEG
ncbi:MAG: DUF106 domain-containing protein [Thermoplasmatota archaeon]